MSRGMPYRPGYIDSNVEYCSLDNYAHLQNRIATYISELQDKLENAENARFLDEKDMEEWVRDHLDIE